MLDGWWFPSDFDGPAQLIKSQAFLNTITEYQTIVTSVNMLLILHWV